MLLGASCSATDSVRGQSATDLEHARTFSSQIELFFSWVKSKSKGLYGVRDEEDVRNVVYAGEPLPPSL